MWRWIVACAAVVALTRGARADDGRERAPPRHQIGFQLGGANLMQMVYRVRIVGGLHAELGGFALPYFATMAGTGLVAEHSISDRWSIYAGAGVAWINSASEYACEPTDGPRCTDRIDWRFAQVRVGVAFRHGERGRIGIDLGLWRGQTRRFQAGAMRERDGFLIPMLGVSYLAGL
jgi:hypothetical protein